MHILYILFTSIKLIFYFYDTYMHTYIQRLRVDISEFMALYKCSSSSSSYYYYYYYYYYYMLAEKLINPNVSPKLIVWLIEILVNRSQVVRYHNVLSQVKTTSTRAPMGQFCHLKYLSTGLDNKHTFHATPRTLQRNVIRECPDCLD